MTPEERREMHDKATRILESDQAELLTALINLLYDFAAKERAEAKRKDEPAGGARPS
jgi:hypothetical protein